MKTRRKLSAKVSSRPRPAGVATVRRLKAFFARVVPGTCTLIGDWPEYACLWNGKKYTMHERTVCCYLCCDGALCCGDNAPIEQFISGRNDTTGCVEVYTYGVWKDTGSPCMGTPAEELVPEGPLPMALRGPNAKAHFGRMNGHNGRAKHM